MNNIDINPNLFNPVYWHVLEALSNKDIRHIYVYGGSSAAKTYSIAQALLIDGEMNDYSSIVFRKEQASIGDTIYNDFKEINENFELEHNMLQFLIRLNGLDRAIRFRGVDKSGKVKGLKGFKKILLDELDHFVIDDYKELKRRLRGEDGQQIIYTWNPVSKEHWVKKKILDKEVWTPISKEVENCPSDYSMLSDKSGKWINERGDSILIKTNHLDNYWVCGHPEDGFGRYDKHVMTEFDIMSKLDPEDYKIYAWGEWGNPKVESPYITQFEDDKHIKNVGFDSSKQFIMSFDFNIDNTVALFSHIGNDFIHFFDELEAVDLPKLLDKIKFKYGDYLVNCLVTGDRSGENRTHMISDGMNSYRLIRNILKLKKPQFKIVVNPKHKENRVTCNTLLAFHPDIYFNDRCKQTIFDLKFAECDMEGKLIKKDRNIANQRLEALDCFRYTLNTFKRKWVRNYKPNN